MRRLRSLRSVASRAQRSRARRLLQLPGPVLGPRRRGGGGRVARAARRAPGRDGHVGDQGSGPTRHPGDGGFHHGHLGGLRAVLAGRRRSDQLPVDSASVAEAVWPELAELKGTHFHDTLMSRRAALSRQRRGQPLRPAGRAVASAHSIRGTERSLLVKAATRRKAEATLGRIRKGAKLRRSRVPALGGSGQQDRQGLPSAGAAWPFRGLVRQRRVGARAGADERGGRDSIRLPHHQAARPPGGARALR